MLWNDTYAQDAPRIAKSRTHVKNIQQLDIENEKYVHDFETKP